MITITAAEARMMLAQKRGNKYRAQRVTIDGHRFESKAEGARYGHLLMQQRAGLISELEVHPPFEMAVKGETFRYTADFAYRRDGALVVEDVKSKITARRSDYQMRKRLMKAVLGIEIVEVLS